MTLAANIFFANPPTVFPGYANHSLHGTASSFKQRIVAGIASDYLTVNLINIF
tara:strand:- start:554 stop:712 length:159 start_codon:yes stop_codon:yes gene_type:complete